MDDRTNVIDISAEKGPRHADELPDICAEAYRVADVPGPYRSIDWLIKGTAGGNPYLAEFCSSERFSRTLRALLEDPKFSGWSRRKSKSLRKEIAEACAMVRQVDEQICKLDKIRQGASERLVIFDLCCGKGLSGAMLAHCYEKAKIVLIDNDKHMHMDHINACENAEFYCMDIYSPAVEELIRGAASEHAASIMVGVHLCGDLARRAIELWETCCNKAPTALVLCPCCLVRQLKDPLRRPAGTFGYDTKLLARRLGVNNYLLWCLTLLFFVKQDRKCGKSRDLSWDYDMLTERNAFITAARTTFISNADHPQPIQQDEDDSNCRH